MTPIRTFQKITSTMGIFVALVLLISSTCSDAFSIGRQEQQQQLRQSTALSMLQISQPPLPFLTPEETMLSPTKMSSITTRSASGADASSMMQRGIQAYYEKSSLLTPAGESVSSSSMAVALQERKIPTQEEIDQKKFTFNLIFWGGGFVAPFLATIFYFGFRFWEK